MLQCLGPLVSHSSSPPPDSDEETCSQPALVLTLIFKVLTLRILAFSESSEDVEIVEGVWRNQQPCRFRHGSLGKMELFLSSGGVFSFS